MLVFSASQLQTVAEAAFVRRMMAALAPSAEGEATDEADGEVLADAIREQLQRARRYGFSEERDCALWVACAWHLGADFNRRISAIAQTLQRKDIGAPCKAMIMEAALRALFVSLSGQSRNLL